MVSGSVVLFSLCSCCIFVLIDAIPNQITNTERNFVATECYGGVLSLSCSVGHRIKVLDDFFGFSPRNVGPGMCRYEPGDCTVTNSRVASVIHRYCEGKQKCTSFQVDRRYCGSNQTNYEQVEYECIPDLEITNICSRSNSLASEGYISTPNFPNEYPPNMDCSCSLRATKPEARIRLEATHFIVKFDNPCQDWLQISMVGRKRRLCGAYRSTLRSHSFNLTFHSDDMDGHQGVWLYYSVQPWPSNASVIMECNAVSDGHAAAIATTTTTTAPPITSTVQQTTTETEENLVFINNEDTNFIDETEDYHYETGNDNEIEKDGIKNDKLDKEKDRQNSGKVDSVNEKFGRYLYNYESPYEEYEEELDENDQKEKDETDKTIPHEADKDSSSDIKENKESRYDDEGISKGKSKDPSKGLSKGEYGLHWVATTILSNSTSISATTSATLKASKRTTKPLQSGHNTVEGPDADNRIEEGGKHGAIHATATEIVPSPKSDPQADDIKRRNSNRITGIIIISICVGGIVLLIVILAILLCVNKRKRPKRKAEKERKKRLQQRLNSLSFYDSIPLYDSIGRKAATQILRLPPVPPVDHPRVCALPPPPDGPPQALDPKTLNGWNRIADQASFWTPTPDPESDHDSAIYAELDKQSRGATSEEGAHLGDSGSGLARTTPNGEGPPGYSLHLKPTDPKNEDIYTHV